MGNKRTYRSTPEPRFVKRALETASGKNIDDAIANAGGSVVLEADMEVTTELVEKLQKASQIFYRFTREYNGNTTIYKLPCEVEIHGANNIEEQGIILTVIWDGINSTDGVALEGIVTSFNARFISRLLEINKSTRVEIPALFFFYSADSGLVYLNNEWGVKVLSGVQILSFENNSTGLDLQIIAESSTVYMTLMDEEVGTSLICTPVQATPTVLGSVTSVTLISKDLSSLTNQFNYIVIQVGKSIQEVIATAQSSDFVVESQLKTFFGNKSIIKDPEHPENNNIDLYKHYLTIDAEPSEGGTGVQCSILIQSSSNVDCSSTTGATQKLKTLLKITGTSYRVYESGVANSGASSCALVWTGTILQVNVGGTPYVIKSIVDDVETV